jgi:hypothetical protein
MKMEKDVDYSLFFEMIAKEMSDIDDILKRVSGELNEAYEDEKKEVEND